MNKEKSQIRTLESRNMKYDVLGEAGRSGQDRQQYKQINEKGVRGRNMGTEGGEHHIRRKDGDSSPRPGGEI